MPLTSDDQAKYRSLYFSTAKPYIQELQKASKQFTGGVIDQERITLAHRSAHSLASQSKMMGYEQISSVTSLLEHILRAKLDNELEFQEALLQTMEIAIEKVVEAINKLEAGENEMDLQAEYSALIAVSNIEM